MEAKGLLEHLSSILFVPAVKCVQYLEGDIFVVGFALHHIRYGIKLFKCQLLRGKKKKCIWFSKMETEINVKTLIIFDSCFWGFVP